MKYFVTLAGRTLEVEVDGERVMVDGRGYIYVSGNPEVGVFRPDGGFVGAVTTVGGGDTTNCVYGDGDGRTLYVTSYGGLFRVRPQIP